MQNSLYESEFLIWWDNLKYKIKRFSQIFGKDLQKKKNLEYYKIQNKLQQISEKIATGEDVDISKYENLKLELSELEEEKCKGAILRSKAFWATESDKCTKYFLQLEKKQESNCIKELYNEQSESVNDIDSILDVEYDFYSKLYSSVQIDENEMKMFLNNVEVTISEEDKLLCDNEITIDEIAKALYKMAKKQKSWL